MSRSLLVVQCLAKYTPLDPGGQLPTLLRLVARKGVSLGVVIGGVELTVHVQGLLVEFQRLAVLALVLEGHHPDC